ncbi:MAG: tetratricopeptide repeat protein [Leadbetterella sp.]|nr:tetratricopeptide repeat protein [Leadbetterella sp.]
MNVKNLGLVFLLIASTTVFAQSKDSSLDLGKKKYAAGDYKGALTAFTKAIQADPSNATAYYDRALAEIELEDYDAALKDTRKFHQLQPQDVDGINQISYLLLVKEDFKSLIEWSTQMLKSKDVDVVSNAHYYLGISYSNMKVYDKALFELTKVLASKPKDTDALYARGRLYIDLNKYGEAIKDFSQLLSVDNKHVNAHFWRALVYTYLDKPTDALKDLNTAADLDSTLTYIYDLRGDIKLALADTLGTKADYDKAIALGSDPDYDLLYKRAMLAYRELDDNEDALVYFNKVIAGAPNDYPDIYSARGYIYVDKSLFDKADADFQKFHSLDSADTYVYLNWALAKQGLKQHDEAIRMIKLYLTTKDMSEQSLLYAQYIMAKEMYELADYSHAIEEFNKALDIDTNYGELHYWLAKSLIELKMNDEACAHFEKAHELEYAGVKEDLIKHCGYSEGAFENEED